MLLGPADESALFGTADRARAFRSTLQNTMTPQMAVDIATMSAMHPTMSHAVVLGLVTSGIAAESEEAAAISMEEHNAGMDGFRDILEEWVVNPIEGVVRGGLTGLLGAWEETIPTALRTGVDLYQDAQAGREVSLSGSYQDAGGGQSAAARAIGMIGSGERINLGSSMIPQSQVANRGLVNEAVEGFGTVQSAFDQYSPEEQLQQTQMGAPLTDLARESALRVHLTHEGGKQAGVSLGSLAMINMFEPGSVAYNVGSGMIDAASQFSKFGDPAIMATRAARNVARSAHSVRMTTGGRGLLLSGMRHSVDTAGVPNFLNKGRGRYAVELFRQADSMEKLDSLLKFTKGAVPIELRHALLEANTTEETIQALMPYLGVVVDRVYTPGVNTNILGRMVGARVENAGRSRGFKGTMDQGWGNSYMQRALAEHPDRIIDITQVDKAYGQIQKLGTQMGLSPRQMERHLQRFVALDRHSVDLANDGYDILKEMMLDVNTNVLGRLREAGNLSAETQAMAKYTTQLFKEVGDESIYWLNDAGDVVKNFNSGGSLMVNEAGVPTAGPQLFSELFRGSIVTPDITQVRRMMAETNTVKSWLNKGTSTLTDGKFHDRAWLRVMDSAMSNVWKPLALLRLSWPVKIIAEEQMRMAASGYQSSFHPLTLFSMAIGRKTLGRTTDSAIGAFALSEDFAKASARRSDYMSEVVGGGARQWRRIAKGETGYQDGWFTELNELWSDSLARRVTKDGITDEFVSELLRVGDDMTNDAKKYQQVIRAQPEAVRESWNTTEGAWRYLESVQARVHQKTGGYWRRVVPNPDGSPGGVIYDEMGQTIGTVQHPVPREYYEFGGGDNELLQVIATGKYGDFNVARDFSTLRPEDVHDYMTEGLSRSRAKRPPDELVKDYVTKDLLGRKVNQQPAYVKGTYQTQDPSLQNKVVSRLFDSFMGNPTTKLSRNPTFKQAYWKKIEEMLPYLDDDTATAIRLQAKNAGARIKPRRSVPASARSGFSVEQADSYAKAYALSEVEDLLYSASRKTNLADAMRIIMPFAEAHKEVITTWSKIFMRNPGITHRTNRFIQAGRTGGYFQPGEDGQEKFYWSDLSKDFLPYDVVGNIESAMSGMDAEGGLGSMAPRMAGNLMGMPPFDFIRNGPVPGLGPVAQAVAGKFIPDKPEFDWVRDVVIGPYQSPDIGSVSAFMPSYMKRLYSSLAGLAGSEGNFGMEAAWQSSQKDVLRSMMASGDWDEPRTQEEFNNMVDEANIYTSKQFFIRALGQFVLPSVASQDYRFEKFDEEARDHVTYVELAKEYQNILAGKRGNEQEAWNEFQRLFGTDPTPWLTSKSFGVRPSPATQDASDWKRRNGDLFEKYPDTAYFMMPDDADAEFDIDAWWRSVQDGSRVVYTGDQWLKQHNNMVGRMAYHQMNLQFKNSDGIMKMVRSTLMRKYPGYMEDIAGLPMKATREEQRRQLTEMAKDPDLPDEMQGLARAIQVYLAQEASLNSGARANGVASINSAKSQLGARNQLRQLAMSLGARVPEFMAVYSQVFARDLKDDDALEPVDLYGGLNPWKDMNMRQGNF